MAERHVHCIVVRDGVPSVTGTWLKLGSEAELAEDPDAADFDAGRHLGVATSCSPFGGGVYYNRFDKMPVGESIVSYFYNSGARDFVIAYNGPMELDTWSRTWRLRRVSASYATHVTVKICGSPDNLKLVTRVYGDDATSGMVVAHKTIGSRSLIQDGDIDRGGPLSYKNWGASTIMIRSAMVLEGPWNYLLRSKATTGSRRASTTDVCEEIESLTDSHPECMSSGSMCDRDDTCGNRRKLAGVPTPSGLMLACATSAALTVFEDSVEAIAGYVLQCEDAESQAVGQVPAQVTTALIQTRWVANFLYSQDPISAVTAKICAYCADSLFDAVMSTNGGTTSIQQLLDDY